MQDHNATEQDARGQSDQDGIHKKDVTAHGNVQASQPTRHLSGNGGELSLAALLQFGVNEAFTLSGGHIFPLLDAFYKQNIPLYDTRHEQTAAFAAEGISRLAKRPGVALVTAGPGVTNSISALVTAQMSGSPLVVLAGRSPDSQWGMGALQELDHVPIVSSITKRSATIHNTTDVFSTITEITTQALSPKRGPVFADIPMDAIFATANVDVADIYANGAGNSPGTALPTGTTTDGTPVGTTTDGTPAGNSAADAAISYAHYNIAPSPIDETRLDEVCSLMANMDRVAIMIGSDLWWAGSFEQLKYLAEEGQFPVYSNGQGRGCLPASHSLSFSRTRSKLAEADLVVVVGTPLDFRLNYGRFGNAKVVHITDVGLQPENATATSNNIHSSEQFHEQNQLNNNKISLTGDITGILAYLGDHLSRLISTSMRNTHMEWIDQIRQAENSIREEEKTDLGNDSSPIHPARIYGELIKLLDKDAVIVGDGGDFVSYAGRLIDSYQPGCWLDPGPYGCLGCGIGYSMAARILYPSRQVVLLQGDGAFGFAGMDVDTLVRHNLPVVIIVGNNGIWGLEKHPMQAIYGYDVAADLRQETRYDIIVEAMGGAGETVKEPSELAPALKRAFDAQAPYLINVMTDPQVAYPRRTSIV